MKESVRKIRMDIAGRALRQLIAGRVKQPGLTDLFYVTGDNPTQAEFAEGDSKPSRKWQREFMRRLMSDGVVDEVEADHWSVKDQVRLIAIISNLTEDGALLSNYLFLTDAEFRNKRSIADSAEDGYTLAAAEEDNQEEKPPLDDAAIARELAALGNLQRTLIEGVGKNHIAFDKSLLTIIESLQGLLEVVIQLRESVQKREGGIGKRVETVEERLVGMQKVLEAMQQTLKGVAQNLGALDNAAKIQARSEQILEECTQMAARTDAKIDGLISVLAAERKDKLGQVLKRLDEHVRDGRTLYDMLLDGEGGASGNGR